jgi:hypothetical protein
MPSKRRRDTHDGSNTPLAVRSEPRPAAPVACPYDWPYEYVPSSDHLSYRASVLTVGVILVVGSITVIAAALLDLS